MNVNNLLAISPVDGRYNEKTSELRTLFSEFGLMKHRLMIEVDWLTRLSDKNVIGFNIPFNLYQAKHDFDIEHAKEIKGIEYTTNHDVKAVELFVRRRVPKEIREFVHFGCTSEDINNLAYGHMIKEGIRILSSNIIDVLAEIAMLADKYFKTPMLARTHGQPATPTTVGKEFSVYYHRIRTQRRILNTSPIYGKFNGATGNYSAWYAAYPELDWVRITNSFIEAYKFQVSNVTTQIEPQDYMVDIFNTIAHLNDIMVDLCRDVWGYIALDYFKQKVIESEVGSSTMPHKVNPIDFENAESNFGVANALLKHLAEELPKSRWQRDLTNSSRLRNVGVAFAHSLIGYKSLIRGLTKIEINSGVIAKELNDNWAVLAEAIQTVMRKHQIEDPYTQLKNFTRGKEITKDLLHRFIFSLDIPEEDVTRLLNLTPATYLGNLD